MIPALITFNSLCYSADNKNKGIAVFRLGRPETAWPDGASYLTRNRWECNKARGAAAVQSWAGILYNSGTQDSGGGLYWLAP